MKNIVLVIVILVNGVLVAQNGRPPGRMPQGAGKPSREMVPNGEKPAGVKQMDTEEFLAKMIKDLEINELQQLQVREMLNDLGKKGRFSQNRYKTDDDAQRMNEKAETGKNEMDVKLSKILTEEQFKKWQEQSKDLKPQK